MSQPLHAAYLFDPLCGWCYGASGALQRLAEHSSFAVDLAPTGLFSGSGARPMDDNLAAYAWKNDQQITQLTRQPFSETYRQDILGNRTRAFDSAPATLALTAIALTDPAREREGLSAIQKARFVEGRDVTDTLVLIEILRAIGVNVAADALAAQDANLVASNERRVQNARADMRTYGVEGVPALIVGDGKVRHAVGAAALVGNIDVLIVKLHAA